MVLTGLAGTSQAMALTYQSSVKMSFTINSSLSIGLSAPELVISELAPGASSDSNTITVTVDTNASCGYVLNATVGQATSYETRDLVLSGTEDAFTSLAYGSSLASLTSDNTWGFSYKPSTTGASWTNYSGLPRYDDSTNVTTLISTDAAGETNSVDFKIAARASNEQSAGEYKNVINFIAIANPEPELEPMTSAAGKICYYANSLTPVEGTMGCQSAADGNTVMLFASNFSREGYGFAGWSDAYDYDSNPDAHLYGPNEDIVVPTGTTANGLSLYAVWVRSEGYFQDSDASDAACNGLIQPSNDGSTNLNSVTALTDQRDGQTYAIAKLSGGRCWMIENLRLADTHQEGGSTVTTTLTIDNTNDPLNDNSIVALKHNYSDSQTYTSLSPSSNTATYPDGWCTDDSAACDDQSRLRTDNTANRVVYSSGQTMSSHNVNLYSYGNYYNWYSATAGKGSSGLITNNLNASGSICPSGWKLPRNGQTTAFFHEFYRLVRLMVGDIDVNEDPGEGYGYYGDEPGAALGTAASKALRSYPNNYVYSGYVVGASLVERGDFATYWSLTTKSSSFAYNLKFIDNYVSPGTDFDNKYLGKTVRCVKSIIESM